MLFKDVHIRTSTCLVGLAGAVLSRLAISLLGWSLFDHHKWAKADVLGLFHTPLLAFEAEFSLVPAYTLDVTVLFNATCSTVQGLIRG